MITQSKLSAFLRFTLTLGQTPIQQFKILWALSKIKRARAYQAYNPERVYKLGTVIRDVYLRDNFGDVINLFLPCRERLSGRMSGLPRRDSGCWGKDLPAGSIHRSAGLTFSKPLPSNAAMVRKNCPAAIVNQIGLGRDARTLALGVDRHGVMASSIASPR